MELKKRLTKVISLHLIFLLFGCAYYSMAGSIPANISNVSIPLFVNDTPEFELSEKLTSEIVQQISIQNVIKITNDIDSDSVIDGSVVSVSDGPYAFNNNEQVSEYRFSLSVKVSWIDNEDDSKLFEKTFSAFGTYSIDNDPSSDGLDNDNDGVIDADDSDEFGDSRELAINVAINKIAVDIVNTVLSTW
ncbi:MAG: LPS assembly lipoprotein LptE [Fidelibacterota bacterium]